MPEVKEKRYRAEAFSSWNLDENFSQKFVPTPIYLYSYDENLNEIEYLKDILPKEKMKLYKLGSVAHEVAHHVYDYIINPEQKKEWEQIINKINPITNYAKSYFNTKLKYEESFAEAVRLKTTVPNYLKINFPIVYQFFINNIPDIKDGNLKYTTITKN